MHPHPCRHAAALRRIRAILATLDVEPEPPPGLTPRGEAILAHWPRVATSAADVVAALWPLGGLPGDVASRALRDALAPPSAGGFGATLPPPPTSVGSQLRELARRSPRVRSKLHPARGVKLWWVLESADESPV